MAEEEVSYASVVIKNKKQPQSEVNTGNETVYDEVKVNKEPAQGLLLDRSAERCHRYQLLVGCFGALCVILGLSVIGVCVYFATACESAERELKQLSSSHQALLEMNQNLTELNIKLTSDNENLTIQFDNLTTASEALEVKISTLTAENLNLTLDNEELREERNNLTDQIENMEENWNELNVSRAQWSVDQYCPNGSGARVCTSCQNGWSDKFSSCYAVNNQKPSGQRTWKEARDDCRGKGSDLTVIEDEDEKEYVSDNSWSDEGINGYWIGLRAVEGKWRWINGSELTNLAWIQQQSATDGQCVTSLRGRGWKSVSCDDRNAWICEKKALSL